MKIFSFLSHLIIFFLFFSSHLVIWRMVWQNCLRTLFSLLYQRWKCCCRWKEETRVIFFNKTFNESFLMEKFSRRFKFARSSLFWHHFRNYFPLELVKTAELLPNRNYLIASFPHGILRYL